MSDQNFKDSTEEWSVEILGARFVEGTAADAVTWFFAIFILFFFYYGIFKLVRLRWGVYESLFITILLIHIIPIILLWIIKYTPHQ